MNRVRVRFAPSPTGFLHIGGLRTALYNYLYAKKNGGDFILRIEDTDRTRYVEGAIENLIHALDWSGVHVDEGVVLDEEGNITEKGECGPYIQSSRLDIYRKYVDELIEKGYAYYCFCSVERLEALREEQRIKGKVPKYDGLCRSVSIEEAKKRIAAGEDYVVRLKLPHDRNIRFHDLVRGDVVINSDEIDDQVLMKSDGFPTYHMAVVVDDHLMGVTHIVRGEEWLSSTPKHVYLYEALGWDVPEFVHLPTVLNKDHKKLSKRQGDVSVEDFRGKGYLPEGLINYLALVGWSPDGEQEILSMDELIDQFSFEKVVKSGGVFDIDKLNWVNAHYMRSYDLDKICELAIPFVVEKGLMTEEEIKDNYEWYKKLVEIVRDGASKLDEIPEQIAFMFGEVKVEEESAKEQIELEHVSQLLDAFLEELETVEEVDEEFAGSVMKKIQKKTGIKGKNLFMPVRVAISGTVHGPDLKAIIYLLGKEKLVERLNAARKYTK